MSDSADVHAVEISTKEKEVVSSTSKSDKDAADESRKSRRQTMVFLRNTLEKYLSENPNGLTSEKATALLAEYGPNSLPEKVVTPLEIFLKHAWGKKIYTPEPIPVILWAAIIITLVLNDYVDFVIVFLLYAMNVALGFVEEYRAGNSVAALKNALAPTAVAKRDGEWKTIPAVDLVPGDLLRLRIGDVAPADCILCDGHECAMDQSSLTGESLPSNKKGGDMCFSGTTVKRGEVAVYVAATAANTEFGKTAALIASVESESRFMRILNGITNFILSISVLVNIALIVIELERGQEILPVLERSLVLLVASTPVASPLIANICMATGARKMAQEKAIVTKLSAMEELSSMTILCSDKTGTLTLNKLQLDEPWMPKLVDDPAELPHERELTDTANHVYAPSELLFLAGLSTVMEGECDAIDTSVKNAVDKGPFGSKLHSFEQVGFLPFDPSNRRTTAIIKAPEGTIFAVCKGAPKVVLSLCDNKDAIGQTVADKEHEYASRGLRTLGVAISASSKTTAQTRGDEITEWHFLGLLTLFDPPRTDTADVIRRAHELGVAVKMITGDARPIAIETAKRLGMGSSILPAEKLHQAHSDPMAAAGLYDLCLSSDGFAEVFPEDKFNIVATLQHDGAAVVGMTGDGVNDAPALKKSNVGFAVANATAAARGAADLVLLDEGLSVVISAIVRSRKVFERLKNYCTYRVNVSFSLLFFFFIVIVFMELSLPPIIIVIVSLLLDVTVITIAKDYVPTQSLKKPGQWNVVQLMVVSIVMGCASAMGSVLIMMIFRRGYLLSKLTLAEQLSLAYLQISLVNQIDVFVARCRWLWVVSRPGYSLILASLGEMILTTFLAVYWPFGSDMSGTGWAVAGVCWGLNIILVFLLDFAKMLTYRAVDSAQGKPIEQKAEEVKRDVRVRMSKLY
jgi:H+-transporting ATPase